MILPFNADRLLTRVATAGSAAGTPSAPGSPTGSPLEAAAPAVRDVRRFRSRQRPARSAARPPRAADRDSRGGGTGAAAPRPDQRRRRLVAGVQLLVSVRGVTLLRDHVSPLLVVEFAVDRMWWTAPCLFVGVAPRRGSRRSVPRGRRRARRRVRRTRAPGRGVGRQAARRPRSRPCTPTTTRRLVEQVILGVNRR